LIFGAIIASSPKQQFGNAEGKGGLPPQFISSPFTGASSTPEKKSGIVIQRHR